jgi:hypothetical protein
MAKLQQLFEKQVLNSDWMKELSERLEMQFVRYRVL